MGASDKIQNRRTNSVDPDETAHNEPSHQDLRCFKIYLFESAGMKGLTLFITSLIQYCLFS